MLIFGEPTKLKSKGKGVKDRYSSINYFRSYNSAYLNPSEGQRSVPPKALADFSLEIIQLQVIGWSVRMDNNFNIFVDDIDIKMSAIPPDEENHHDYIKEILERIRFLDGFGIRYLMIEKGFRVKRRKYEEFF